MGNVVNSTPQAGGLGLIRSGKWRVQVYEGKYFIPDDWNVMLLTVIRVRGIFL